MNLSVVQCLNNRDPVPASCKHFAWRRDIPRGKDGRPKAICVGELCQGVGNPKSVNLECPFGFCARCCRHVQAILPSPVPCGYSNHRKGVEYTKPAAGGKSRFVT